MKKFFFIAFFSFVLFFNPYKAYSSDIPQSYGGQIISLQEYQQYVDYCFYTNFFILDATYGFSSESNIDLNYRLYSMDNGEMILGFGEQIIQCYTERAAINTFGNTSAKPQKYNQTLKRGISDRCLGVDWFDGLWYVYGCIPETGAWYIIPNSVGGSAYDSKGTYDCYDTATDKYYGGSSYLNLVISKKKLFGVTYEDSYYYRTFSCVKDSEIVATNPTLVQLKAGLTTSRTSADIGSNGTGGSTGGTGGSTGASNEKIEEIKTQLTQIQNDNSSFKSENLGKLSEVKSEILLQNEYLAVNQNVLTEKLDSLEQKNQLLKQDLNNKIELENNNLKNSISENLETQTNDLKTKIDDSNLDLTNKINDNQLEINNLEDLINGFNADDVSGRNEILGRLSTLENQISGIGTSLENIGNNQGSGDGTGTADLTALGQGLTNIDNTLKNSLIDENEKPYLKSIDDILKGQSDSPDDTSDLNSLVGSELGFSFSKYSNLLNSSFCSAPNNITFSLMGNTYTLLDFSVLNPYVGIIRTLFISLASLLGLLFFLRGSK